MVLEGRILLTYCLSAAVATIPHEMEICSLDFTHIPIAPMKYNALNVMFQTVGCTQGMIFTQSGEAREGNREFCQMVQYRVKISLMK